MRRSESLNPRAEPRAQLLLVRHSSPSITDGMSYRDWPLSNEGKKLAVRAAEGIAEVSPGQIFASDERKALETAKIIGRHCGVAVEVEPDLREHDRTGVTWRDSATRQRELEALFANPSHVVFGRESGSQALRRLTAAIDRVTVRTPGPWVLVTHGTIMALYLAELTGRAPMEIWSCLRMPTVASVDWRNHRLVDLVTDFQVRQISRTKSDAAI